jgi:glutamate-1-semialdehyde 2,1-aminomutase
VKPSTNSKQWFPIIAKASGKYCWSVDGRKYIDFTGANLTTVLGYRPRKSVVPNFSGVSSAEAKLNKLLQERTGTNYFRYYTNGSDAVNNGIRLARHILEPHPWGAREVYFIGYAGSNDSYSMTINDNGLPWHECTCNYQLKDFNRLPEKADILVFESRYADIADKIKAKIKICDTLKDGVRALYPSRYYYEDVPKGVMRVWEDDYGVYPIYQYDFYCYGKSIFNGSAGAILTGKDEYMKRIDEVYYSTTFGSNNDMLVEGIRTIKDFEKVKNKYFELYDYAKKVLPPWQSLKPDQIKEFQKHGVLYNGYWGILIKHTKKDIDNLKKLIDLIL